MFVLKSGIKQNKNSQRVPDLDKRLGAVGNLTGKKGIAVRLKLWHIK